MVEILLVVEYLAYRRIGLSGNFHEIKLEIFCNLASFLNGVYAGSNVVANKSYFASTDMLVDVVRGLLGLARVAALGAIVTRTLSGIVGAGSPGVKRFFLFFVGLLINHLIDLIGQMLCKVSNFHRTKVTFTRFSY